MPELEVREASTQSLVPYVNNAKLHSADQIDQIVSSIEEFGFNDPIGVWENAQGELEIVEGHGRVLAAEILGLETVPIIYLNHLTDEQRRAYTHVHNQTTLTSGFDDEVLERELESLDFDWESFGFDIEEEDFVPIDLDSVGSRDSKTVTVTVHGKKYLVGEDEADMLYDGFEQYIDEEGLSVGYIRSLYA